VRKEELDSKMLKGNRNGKGDQGARKWCESQGWIIEFLPTAHAAYWGLLELLPPRLYVCACLASAPPQVEALAARARDSYETGRPRCALFTACLDGRAAGRSCSRPKKPRWKFYDQRRHLPFVTASHSKLLIVWFREKRNYGTLGFRRPVNTGRIY